MLKGIQGRRPPVFTAHIIMPPTTKMSREVYIDRCYKFYRVHVKNHYGEIIKARVGNNVIQNITFPQTQAQTEFGSYVLCGTDLFNKEVYVIDVLNEQNNFEAQIDDEFSYKLVRLYRDRIALVYLKGKEGIIVQIVDSKDSKTAESSFKFLNNLKLAKVDYYIQGNYILFAEKGVSFKSNEFFEINVFDEKENKQTSIQYKIDEGFVYKDQFENEFLIDKNGKFTIKNKNVNFGELLIKTLQQISNIQTLTAIGNQPILNKAEFEKLIKDFKKIL